MPAKHRKADVIRLSDLKINTGTVEAPPVFVAVCPTNGEHVRVRIHSRSGVSAHCCCDDCGATWTVGPSGPGKATVRDPRWVDRLKAGDWKPAKT